MRVFNSTLLALVVGCGPNILNAGYGANLLPIRFMTAQLKMDDEASQIQFFGISDDGEASAVRLDSTADSASQLKMEDEDTSMKTLPLGLKMKTSMKNNLLRLIIYIKLFVNFK